MTNEKEYSIGDQIVHVHYGSGKIIAIEEKELFGNAKRYYVVQTKNSTYWLPIDNDDSERIRPIADPDDILEVIEILEDTPQEMADDHKNRKKRIKAAKVDGKLSSTASLVRDLSYRQEVGHISTTERKALERLKDRLVNEWAASKQISVQKVQERINKIFRRYQE